MPEPLREPSLAIRGRSTQQLFRQLALNRNAFENFEIGEIPVSLYAEFDLRIQSDLQFEGQHSLISKFDCDTSPFRIVGKHEASDFPANKFGIFDKVMCHGSNRLRARRPCATIVVNGGRSSDQPVSEEQQIWLIHSIRLGRYPCAGWSLFRPQSSKRCCRVMRTLPCAIAQPGSPAAERRKRHQAIYAMGGFISQEEARQALETAEKYLKTINGEIRRRSPQAELDMQG